MVTLDSSAGGTRSAGGAAGSSGGYTSAQGGAPAGGMLATGGTQSVPAKHRPSDTACPEQRGAGDTFPNPSPGGECAQDSDCTAGINGRCLAEAGIDIDVVSCSYDTCFSDSDCSDNRPCECRQSETDSAANYCVVTGGNCRIDSDCGPGGFCSPSLLGDYCGFDSSIGEGYFCHTPQDSCLNDSDCDSASICAYSLQISHFTCVTGYLC